MDTTLPKRIKLLDWGENPSDRGVFTVDETTAELLRKQIEDATHERLVIDFDHQSEPGSDTFEKSPRHHAGYGMLEVVEGDGVYLADVEWTPTGENFAGDYRDLSPALLVDDEQRVVGITSVAVVTNGGLQGRTLLRAVRLDAPASADASARTETGAQNADAADAPAGSQPGAEGASPSLVTLHSAEAEPAADAAGEPPAADPPEDRGDLAEISGRIDNIEKAMSERAAALDQAMAGIVQRLDAIEEKLAAAKPAEPAADPEPLAARAPVLSSGEAPRAGEEVLLAAGQQLLAAEKERLAAEAAEKDAARERAHLVQMAVAAGKAVTLPEAVLSKMTPAETRAYLATLPAALPVSSAVRAAGPERPVAAPGREREDARALLVAKLRRDHPDFDFNRAWTEARRTRPDLFRNGAGAAI